MTAVQLAGACTVHAAEAVAVVLPAPVTLSAQLVKPTADVGRSKLPLTGCPTCENGLAPVHTMLADDATAFVDDQVRRGAAPPCTTTAALTDAVSVGTPEQVELVICQDPLLHRNCAVPTCVLVFQFDRLSEPPPAVVGRT